MNFLKKSFYASFLASKTHKKGEKKSWNSGAGCLPSIGLLRYGAGRSMFSGQGEQTRGWKTRGILDLYGRYRLIFTNLRQ